MATINLTLTGCPTDCDEINTLPAIPEEQACASYEQTLSQIGHLYLMPTGAANPWANWGTTPTAPNGNIDNTEGANAKSKWLVGIGEIPAAEKTQTEYPLRKSKQTDRLYTLTFRVPNLSDALYNFLRKMQCGYLGFTFWYGDLGGWLYGLSAGLVPDFVTVTFPKGEGNADKNVAIIRLSWRATGDPERRANPLA
jgi:hypothetical protein